MREDNIAYGVAKTKKKKRIESNPMNINEVIKGLRNIIWETGDEEVTLKINNRYYDITEIYYDSYLEEIIIEHKTEP